MPRFACSICDAAGGLCAHCARAKKLPFDGLPVWPGARQMAASDDDDDDNFSDKPSKGGRKGKGDEDDDDGNFSEKPSGAGKKRRGKDDDDDDRPRKRSRDSSDAPAKTGMGVGMILLIVGGLAACCLCVPGILAALLIPAVQKVREAAARAQAMNNIKQISLACHSYHNTFNTLPSPRMATAEMSWRVEVLPYMEEMNMFNQINKNTAWNLGPNAVFNNQMPKTFDFPGENPGINTSDTKFQYFVGPTTMFPDPLSKFKMTQITDGTSNTFLFAEAATPVPWMKPADMAITPNGVIPVPPGRFMAAMADGAVHIIDRGRVNDNTLRALITPTGKEQLPPGIFDN
jgi:hypothetical protein